MKFFYGMVYAISKFFFHFFYRHQVFGKKNLPTGPCILAPNHVSYLDPPLVAISCNEEVNFLARGSLFKKSFLFKKLLSSLNSYPITGTGQDIASIKLIIYLLEHNKKIVIFPEGQRAHEDTLLPIKPGIGMLASRCHCPIIPVYIHGTYNIWPRRNFLPKLWGRTACVFGSPISWEDYKHLHKKEAQERIAKTLEESIKDLKEWYLHGPGALQS